MQTGKASKTEALFILPFGQIPKEVLDFLQIELTRRLGFHVRVNKADPLPQYAFNPWRNQYHSTKILENLRELKTDDERILGIIDTDLYVPELNFVFGEAHIADKVCVISLVRLRQEYYGLPKDKNLFLSRTLKEAIHELGHTFKLSHCEDPKCIMHFSNSLRDTDIKGPDFCNRCKLKLR
ncbi:MAG: archaemetzincin family Zn-dependent metalloprotease [Candidatus Brocadia sp.]|jgi:archaemetzincin